MIDMKRVFVPFELKATDEKSNSFEGYASVFGNVDEGGDRILPGAFKSSLASKGHKLPLYVEHNHLRGDLPIGTAMVEEDARGLKTLGFPLVEEIPRAREAMALLRAGGLKGMSIGFITREAVRDVKTGVRDIKLADVEEVSLTGFPMNRAAGVTAVKSLAEFATAELLAEALKSGRPFDADFARELATLAFDRVQSASDAEVKSTLESAKRFLEGFKS